MYLYVYIYIYKHTYIQHRTVLIILPLILSSDVVYWREGGVVSYKHKVQSVRVVLTHQLCCITSLILSNKKKTSNLFTRIQMSEISAMTAVCNTK